MTHSVFDGAALSGSDVTALGRRCIAGFGAGEQRQTVDGCRWIGLVRGLGRPDKVSHIAEISAVELRSGLAETVSADIPPQHQSYWLAVEIFRQTGESWTSIARRDATAVPHTYELDGRDVVLEIA